MTNETWGFIGLGHIGYPMAMTLREKMPASHPLIIQDVNHDAVKRFQEEVRSKGTGANSMKLQTADSAREVAERSDVLITCLPSPKIVDSVFQSILQNGMLRSMKQERLFIDCSTIDPQSSREVARKVHESQSGSFVDAPVSGGVVGARAGTLSFMFGAPQSSELVDRVRSVLSLMGTSSWHMGESGAGVSAKLANNYILGVTNIATAEAFNMAHQWGLDLKALTELIKTSTGRCWPVEANNPVPGIDKNSPSSKGYAAGGSINIMKKDVGLAVAGAKASGAKLQLGDKAYEMYDTIGATEDGEKDLSFVYKWLQERSSK